MEESRSRAKEGGGARRRPRDRAAPMSLVLTEKVLLKMREASVAGVKKGVGGDGEGGLSTAEELQRKSLIFLFCVWGF